MGADPGPTRNGGTLLALPVRTPIRQGRLFVPLRITHIWGPASFAIVRLCRYGNARRAPEMLERDRRRHGLRVCRAAWLLGMTVREYREFEAGSFPTSDAYERICEVFGWPLRVRRRYR